MTKRRKRPAKSWTEFYDRLWEGDFKYRMAKANANKPKSLKIYRRRLTVRLIGTSPLVTHNWAAARTRLERRHEDLQELQELIEGAS